MAVAVHDWPKAHVDAIRAELEIVTRKLMLIADPDFWRGYRAGIRQIERGEAITYEELLEKYEI